MNKGLEYIKSNIPFSAGFHKGDMEDVIIKGLDIIINDHLKIIKEIGQLCVGKPSRYDSEQIEKIRKLCLKQIYTLSTEKLKEGKNE